MMRPMVAVAVLLLSWPAPRIPSAVSAGPGPSAAAIGQAGRLRLVPAPTGNEARFRVKEQLAELTLPNVAVGVTSNITGSLVLDHGKVVPSESRFTVDLASLRSDRDRRDQYVKRRTLETDRFPNAELAVTDLGGLPSPLPTSGSFTFTIVGDLTIHGVTRPSTWQVTAEVKDREFSGTASTRVKFEDFGMTQPRVAIVLSVEDDIALEYQFHLVREPLSR